ncbi:unnamed protein product [Victoria cruziana]
MAFAGQSVSLFWHSFVGSFHLLESSSKVAKSVPRLSNLQRTLFFSCGTTTPKVSRSQRSFHSCLLASTHALHSERLVALPSVEPCSRLDGKGALPELHRYEGANLIAQTLTAANSGV